MIRVSNTKLWRFSTKARRTAQPLQIKSIYNDIYWECEYAQLMHKDIWHSKHPCGIDTLYNQSCLHNSFDPFIESLIVGFGYPTILNKSNFKIDIPGDNPNKRDRNNGRHGSPKKQANNHNHHNIGIMVLDLEIGFL